jgi:hypothetical protein
MIGFMAEEKKPATPGPKPQRLKIEGDWKAAMAKAMKKPRPDKGKPRG